jgi:hypothetical protein
MVVALPTMIISTILASGILGFTLIQYGIATGGPDVTNFNLQINVRLRVHQGTLIPFLNDAMIMPHLACFVISRSVFWQLLEVCIGISANYTNSCFIVIALDQQICSPSSYQFHTRLFPNTN